MNKRKFAVDEEFDVPDCDYIFKFNIVPSLKRLSNVTIATTLWSCDNSREFIKSSVSSTPTEIVWSESSWKKVIDSMREKMCCLPLPKVCKNELSRFVKTTGIELKDWICYHDQNIFGFFVSNKNTSKAYKFIDNVVWTNRGTVDYENSIRGVVAEESLTQQERYLISCMYCFRDKIGEFGQNLDKEKLLTIAEARNNKHVYYWTSLLLNDELKNLSIKCNIPSTVSAVAKYINESRKTWMTHPALKFNMVSKATKLSNRNPCRKVRSQVEFSPSTMPLRDLLCSFLNNFLWVDYFLPTMYANLYTVSEYCFYSVLKMLHRKIADSEDDCMYDKYASILEELLTFIPKEMTLLTNHIYSYSQFLKFLLALNWDKHLHVVELLYAGCCVSIKKSYIKVSPDNSAGVNICMKLLQRNQFQHLKNFVRWSEGTELEIRDFKKWFLEKKGTEIIVFHIKMKNVPQLNEFMQWALESEDDIKKFKSSTYRQALGMITHYMIFITLGKPRPVFDIQLIDSYLMWRCDSQFDQVKRLKVEIALSLIHNKINKLVMEKSPDCVRKIMDYLFEDNVAERARFKEEKKNHKIYEFL